MNEEQREIITTNFEFLLNQCKSDALLPSLNQMLDISPEEYDELMGFTNKKTQTRKLLTYLMERGPNTYDKFINALSETRQYKVLDVLKPNGYKSINMPGKKNEKTRAEKVFHEMTCSTEAAGTEATGANALNCAVDVTSQEEELNVTVKIASNFDYENILQRSKIPFYNTTSRNRGIVKIINIDTFIKKKDRKGSEVDVKNLTDLFTQMGFFVDVYNNKPQEKTKINILNSIQSFVNNENLKDADIAMLFLMSHGGEENGIHYFCSYNEERIYIKEVEMYFTNDKCKYMVHKPKFIFIQACRGESPDYGVRQIETDSAVCNNYEYIPTYSDLIIAQSTCPGIASHRDTKMGTWFIYLLCFVFMNEAHEKDVETMLKQIYHKLRHERTGEGTMQTGEFLNRTFNHCYLNPGIYRDGDRVCFFDNILREQE